MRVAASGVALLLGFGVVAATPARADSQMHQSPLLERGSQQACESVRQGREQRGGFAWQYSCPGVPRGDGPGGRRGR